MPRAPPPPHNSCAQGRATDIASTLLDKPDRPRLKSADRKSLSGEAARWNGSSARMVEGRACRATLFQTDLGLAQKQLRILEQNHPHPGPLPSDGRGRIVLRRSAYPTALRDGSGCSLSRRTGEGQGEGRFVVITPPVRYLFLHKPYARRIRHRQVWRPVV